MKLHALISSSLFIEEGNKLKKLHLGLFDLIYKNACRAN